MKWLPLVLAVAALSQLWGCGSDAVTGAPSTTTDGQVPAHPVDASKAGSDGSNVEDGASPDGTPPPSGSGPEVLYPLLGANVSHLHMDAQYLWWQHGNSVYQAPRGGSVEPQRIGTADGGAANRFADDATHVYWLSRDRIVRAPKQGGATEEWPLGASYSFGAWAMDDAFVYLTNAFAAALWRMPKGGGALEVVADPLNTQGDGGGAVNLTQAGPVVYVSYLGDVFQVDLDGGGTTRLATGLQQASEVTRFDAGLFWLDSRSREGCDVHRYRDGPASEVVAHLASPCLTTELAGDVEGGQILFFPSTLAPLTAFDVAGGSLTPLTEAVRATRHLVADGSYVYWTRHDLDAPAIMRMRRR